MAAVVTVEVAMVMRDGRGGGGGRLWRRRWWRMVAAVAMVVEMRVVVERVAVCCCVRRSFATIDTPCNVQTPKLSWQIPNLLSSCWVSVPLLFIALRSISIAVFSSWLGWLVVLAARGHFRAAGVHQWLLCKVVQRLLKSLPDCVCHVLVGRKPFEDAATGIVDGCRKPTRSQGNETDLYRALRVAAARSSTRRPDGALPSLPGEPF